MAKAEWKAGAAWKVGDVITDSNGNAQRCTTAGISGTMPPKWQETPYAYTDDGTTVWTLLGLAPPNRSSL
jgi:hypothetical protein